MTGPDDRVEVWIGDGPVEVGRNSVMHALFEGAAPKPAARRMRWSLGMPADLIWMLVPESRPLLAELAAGQFETAVELGRELHPVDDTEAVLKFWARLAEPALKGFPDTRADAERYCAFIRLVWDFDCPEQERVRQVLGWYVLEDIASTPVLWTVEVVDPALFQLIRDEYGDDFDLSPDRGDRPTL